MTSPNHNRVTRIALHKQKFCCCLTAFIYVVTLVLPADDCCFHCQLTPHYMKCSFMVHIVFYIRWAEVMFLNVLSRRRAVQSPPQTSNNPSASCLICLFGYSFIWLSLACFLILFIHSIQMLAFYSNREPSLTFSSQGCPVRWVSISSFNQR